MASSFPAFPDYAVILLEGYSDGFDPGVLESEMEKGMSKLRISQSRVVKKVALTLTFKTIEDSLQFEEWYFNEVKRIGFFTWVDCRGGHTRICRLKGGAIGELTPTTGDFGYSKRSVTLEYIR